MAKGKEKGTAKRTKKDYGGTKRGQRFTDAFKAKAVKAAKKAREQGKKASVAAVAKELGITHQTLYNWIAQAEA